MLDGVSVWGGLRAGLALLRDEKATNASPQVGSLDLRPAVRPSHFTFSGANLVEKHHFQAKYSNFSEPLSNHTSCIHNRSNNLSQSSLICRLSALAAASSDSSVFVLATECTSVNTIYFFITNIKTTVVSDRAQYPRTNLSRVDKDCFANASDDSPTMMVLLSEYQSSC